MTFSEEARDWLRRAIHQNTGIRVQAFDVVPMKGANSSSLYLISCLDTLSDNRFVLRVLDDNKWVAEEPDLARHEAAALEEASKAGLRAPALLEFCESTVPFGAPVVLMAFVEGTVEICPCNLEAWMAQIAAELAAIHQHEADGFPWQFQSWVDKPALMVPAWTTIPEVWQSAIKLVLEPPPDSRAVFIHRDYHPANVLFEGNKVSGVVDWINACRGPVGVDVAHCRMNLALMFGPDVAARFLELYSLANASFEFHHYWEIDSLLSMCWPEPEFYKPWLEFGFPLIPDELLQQRTDEYLQRIMNWVA